MLGNHESILESKQNHTQKKRMIHIGLRWWWQARSKGKKNRIFWQKLNFWNWFEKKNEQMKTKQRMKNMRAKNWFKHSLTVSIYWCYADEVAHNKSNKLLIELSQLSWQTNIHSYSNICLHIFELEICLYSFFFVKQKKNRKIPANLRTYETN